MSGTSHNNVKKENNKKETGIGEGAKKNAAVSKEKKILPKRDSIKAMTKKEKDKVSQIDELKKYLRGVINEVKKVHWLGTREVVIYTVVVLVAVLFVGSLIWLFDSLLSMVLKVVLSK